MSRFDIIRMMERRRGINFRDFSVEQLFDVVEHDSFSSERKKILVELNNRGCRLPPKVFRLAFPDSYEEFTGKSMSGFCDVDEIPVGIPLRQLVFIGPDGEMIRSTEYI